MAKKPTIEEQAKHFHRIISPVMGVIAPDCEGYSNSDFAEACVDAGRIESYSRDRNQRGDLDPQNATDALIIELRALPYPRQFAIAKAVVKHY